MKLDSELEQRQNEQKQNENENQIDQLKQKSSILKINQEKQINEEFSIESQPLSTKVSSRNQNDFKFERDLYDQAKNIYENEIKNQVELIQKKASKHLNVSKLKSQSSNEFQLKQNPQILESQASIASPTKKKVNFQLDRKTDLKRRFRNYTIKALKKQYISSLTNESQAQKRPMQISQTEEVLQKLPEPSSRSKKFQTAYEKYKDQIEAQNQLELLKQMSLEKMESLNKPKKRDN